MATVDKTTTKSATRTKSDDSHRDNAVDQAALMRDVFLLIAEPLGDVEQLLHTELRSDAPFVSDLLEFVSGLGGKRMRPCLLLLSATAAGEVTAAHTRLAAVIEMIHTATLVHDDILDDAEIRRHQITVNRQWGNQAAVLLGDYLFTHAFFLASTVDQEACRIIGRATNAVCTGEMQQIGASGDLDLTEDQYFQIIRGKTGELCACCCELGAQYATASQATVQQMREFGMEVGTAFQIIDDLLDLQGSESATGKSNGSDMGQLKLTLPVIQLLRQVEPAQRDAVCGLLRQAGTETSIHHQILQLLAQYGSIDYAREIAKRLVESALERLSCVDDSAAKQALSGMARFVLSRSA